MIWLDISGPKIIVDNTKVPTVPDITLPWISHNLSAFASITVNLTSSLSRLFDNMDDELRWSKKTLLVSYRRSEYADDRSNSTISFAIYPSSTNCDTYSNMKKKCARFPGCYFC